MICIVSTQLNEEYNCNKVEQNWTIIDIVCKFPSNSKKKNDAEADGTTDYGNNIVTVKELTQYHHGYIGNVQHLNH